ncbi:alanine/glycine:cation symporter family protein [Streptococcus moroccensis]|uniref:AGCS family alanine or glycine:cation symporter n=1 Tax=Streptococcus moroccensis TaxID=1451356 RepID=A0ABT9YSJ6_9STRE|nr:sodium:alanine symporter family protein [Streptococcus moroccensis]MDQ0222974.1 AGCS family alanine or glycine:cation symporter [Streptococcus moroccensis]
MLKFLEIVDAWIWGPPLLFLLMGTGLYLTIRLGFLQLRKLPKAIRLIFKADNVGHGDVSSFAALCTALAATVGTGNIVGVATAVKAGGPGALFWMWVAGLLGMATKYAEGVLAIKYRQVNADGSISGGPMYYITRGLGEKWRPLAIFFSLAGLSVAFFGMGTFTQVNAITGALQGSFNWSPTIMAPLLAILVAIITFGGIQSISKVSTKVIPFMALFYLLASLWIVVLNWQKMPEVLAMIFEGAFTPMAALGGFAGSTLRTAMQNGVARGVFSNESGMGSAPIAAAAAKTEWPAEQGLISMTGTFIDTIVICSLTGIVLLLTGVWSGDAAGAAMTQAAFNTTMPGIGPLILTLSLTLFAFTTILGWSYYGERCFEFIFGRKNIVVFRVLFVLMVGLGGFLELDLVWVLADICNALMVFPNLIAVLGLSPVIIAETKRYLDHLE